eukprot:snap_masked-scaffold_19-processed-gene-3.36-mRNA-1 protein AED:1.00 eAED:1.00 QI:0/0/0/0/1/1/2/0/237
MVPFLKFEHKERLREKVIEEWNKFTLSKSMTSAGSAILTVDVTGPARAREMSRVCPLYSLAVFPLDSDTLRTPIECTFKSCIALTFLPWMIIWDVSIFLIWWISLMPLTYFRILCSMSYLATEKESAQHFSQNVLVLDSGVREKIFMDQKYSPCLRIGRCLCSWDLDVEPNLAAKYGFIEPWYLPYGGDFSIVRTESESFRQGCFSVCSQGLCYAVVNSTVASVIQRARDKFLAENV